MKQTDDYEYHAYLLRFWREDGKTPWRASLENTHTGERRNFASLSQLLDYLEQETGEAVRRECVKSEK